MDKTRNLHHLLDELMQTHDLEPKVLEQKVLALWSECLRRSKHLAPLATNTVPISLSNGILKIHTEYPPYKSSLLFHKSEILADINAELEKPVLTDFRVEIKPFVVKPQETEDQPASPETPEEDSTINSTHQVTSEQLEKIEQTLASVSDTHLRESLWELFTTQSKDNS